jgi:hypothetical protein
MEAGDGIWTAQQSAGPPHIIRFTQPTGSRPSAARTTAKAVNEDDTAELPTFGVQRSALMAGPFRLQPGAPVAGAGIAEEDQ